MPPKLESLQPVLMSRVIEASLRFYHHLGFLETFRDHPTAPQYVGIRRDGIELHLQWHDSKEWDYPNDRPNYRFLVHDIDALFVEFRTQGILNPNTTLRDTPWHTREFHVQDPDRNGLHFYQPL